MEDNKMYDQATVRTISGCPGCRKSAVLVDGACASCARQFGPKFAAWASRIRQDPGFKKLCYEALRTEVARTSFLSTFGPMDATGPATVCQGSR